MFTNWKYQIAVLCLSFAAAGSTVAATMLSFTGTIYGGSNAGTKVSGYVTYELDEFNYWSNGSDVNVGYQSYHHPYTFPLRTSGRATYGDHTVDVGGLGQFDQIGVYVYKNAGFDHADEFMINIGSYDGGVWTRIQLSVYAFTDGVQASGIFGNTDYSNVDWSLDQKVDWFAPGSQTFGVIATPGKDEHFRLDSVTVSEVPEPSAATLSAIALLSFFGARRRRVVVTGRH